MRRRPGPPERRNEDEQARMPKYTIGVVSQLLRLPPQVLRRYEEAGLLEPARQSGKNRLYSDYDLSILEEIVELSSQGINASGIRYILQMRQEQRAAAAKVSQLALIGDLPDDSRPAYERAASDRYRQPSLFTRAD